MNITKKIISIVLVIATMMCVCIPAIAADVEEEVLPNGASFALNQHLEDTASEAKLWEGDDNSYTDENGTNWKYMNNRNYIVSDDDSQYVYRELEDGTIAICYNYTADDFDGEAVIPSELDGKTVTKIDAYAFFSCFNVTGIRIPDTVKEVGYYAFANCTKLERLVIGNSVEKFNAQAINGVKDKIQICFTGSEEDAAEIIVWDRAKLNAKKSFNWASLTNNAEAEDAVLYNVDTNKLEETTTEYSLFIWFFKVYLKSIFDSYATLFKATIDGIKILFTKKA